MEIPTECPECGGDLYDNREKKASGEFKPNAPNFKCKDCNWKDWPGKSGKFAKKTASQITGGKFSEDRTRQIVRQHSQEMALRFCAIKGSIPEKGFWEIVEKFDRNVFSAGKPKAEPRPTPKEPEPEDYTIVEIPPPEPPDTDEGLDL